MTVELALDFQLGFKQETTAGGVAVAASPAFVVAIAQASGVGLDQQDTIWIDKTPRTLAASASETLDLAGVLVDIFGNVTTFVKIKGLLIQNLNTAVGDSLRIGNAANPFLLFDAAADTFTLGPGGLFLWNGPSLAGKPVTPATADGLKIEEIGGVNTVSFNIAIWGTSA